MHLVVDSCSIDLPVRGGAAKSDRFDTTALLDKLGRHVDGETRGWSVVRVPNVAEGRERRPRAKAASEGREQLARDRKAVDSSNAGLGCRRAPTRGDGYRAAARSRAISLGVRRRKRAALS
jgi:hypothetical protein